MHLCVTHDTYSALSMCSIKMVRCVWLMLTNYALLLTHTQHIYRAIQSEVCQIVQHLKAALDNTIAALAKQPDLAGILWERLLQAVVVQPLREDTHMASLARYDISYQLNEIEVWHLDIP